MLKKADIGVGLYLLAAVVFFIVPIPSVLLDVMLAFNISCIVCSGSTGYVFLPDITFVYDYFSNFSERIFHPSDSSDGRSW